MYDAFGKRALDIVVASLALILLSPLLLLTAVLITVKLGRPVLFRQQRGGYSGAPFDVIKFRSMTDAFGPDGALMSDEERLTTFGKFLRSVSIDELPSLWNVLRGEMSLVGPRPLIFDYVALYSLTQARRHEVRPGITGWAQVNGRNAISWDEKFALDVWYVDNRGLWLDVKILFLTIQRVLFREGISPEGEMIMPRFTGTDGRPKHSQLVDGN